MLPTAPPAAPANPMLLNRLPAPPTSGAAAALVMGSVKAAGRISGAADVHPGGTDSRPTLLAWPNLADPSEFGTASEGAPIPPVPLMIHCGSIVPPTPLPVNGPLPLS